jgi:hypothetical protein
MPITLYPNPVVPENPASEGYSKSQPESQTPLPVGVDPESTWLDYSCWVEHELDPGSVLHKPVPQSPTDFDTLALVDYQDPRLDENLPGFSGVNLDSNSTAEDIIQRMATSTYHFVLRGWGRRAYYQIPIPGIYKIAGVTPTPIWPQRATNMLVGNFSGVPIWYATWELHYAITTPPVKPNSQTNAPVPFNPALHIRPDVELPQTIQLPTTIPDQDHLVPNPPVGSPVLGNLTGNPPIGPPTGQR